MLQNLMPNVSGLQPDLFWSFSVIFLFNTVIYVFLLLCNVFLLYDVSLSCCSMYCLFCVVLCIVCVYMCTVLLPPGGYPIAVKKYIISYQLFSGLLKVPRHDLTVFLCNPATRLIYVCGPRYFLNPVYSPPFQLNAIFWVSPEYEDGWAPELIRAFQST
jgi:hypothetical protein